MFNSQSKYVLPIKPYEQTLVEGKISIKFPPQLNLPFSYLMQTQ